MKKKEVNLKEIVNGKLIEGLVGLLLFSVAIIANIDSGDILFKGWSLGWLLSLMVVGYVLGGVFLISFFVDMIKIHRLAKRGSFVEMQLKTELLHLIFEAFSHSNDTDSESTRKTGRCYKNINGKIFLVQGKRCLMCESEPIGKMYLRYSNKKNSYFWECEENHEHRSQFDYKKKI